MHVSYLSCSWALFGNADGAGVMPSGSIDSCSIANRSIARGWSVAGTNGAPISRVSWQCIQENMLTCDM